MYVVSEEEWLAHYGIKGMKWGVRRFQNKDGSLTPEGKKRYKKSGQESRDKATRHYEEQSRRKSMSTQEANKELKDIYDAWTNPDNDYDDLESSPKGRRAIDLYNEIDDLYDWNNNKIRYSIPLTPRTRRIQELCDKKSTLRWNDFDGWREYEVKIASELLSELGYPDTVENRYMLMEIYQIY